MQLTAVFLLAGALTVSAAAKTQTISFTGKDVSFTTILEAIKQQTGYTTLTSDEVIDLISPITIEAKNMPLEIFLKQALAHQPVSFLLDGQNIFFSKKLITAPKLNIPELIAPPLKGVVKDKDGKPLQGATISVKGKKLSTSSGIDGTFTINASEGEIITISYIGYQNTEQKITSDNISFATIVLKPSNSELDEVAVIAYGTTSRRISTTDVSVVKAKDIERKPVGNVLLALQGEIPGVTIEQTSGIPGSAIKVSVRGKNSLSKGSAPFYVLDGVPYFTGNLRSDISVLGDAGVGDGIYGNPLDFINPKDIESITVLKDADATAIYGSRAANGAIIITTKKGSAGPTRVDINFRTGLSRPRFIKTLNTEQYLDMRRQAFINDGLPVPSPTIPEQDKTFENYDLTVYDQLRYTDWQKVFFNDGRFSNGQISLTGGSANTQYLLAIGYTRFQIMPKFREGQENTKNSGNIHFNIGSTSSNQRFTMNFSGSYMDDRNQPPGGDLTQLSYTLAPNAPALFNEDGTLNWQPKANGESTWYNPLISLLNRNKINNTLLNGGLVVGYKVLPHLNILTNLGYIRNQTSEFSGSPAIKEAPEYRAYFTRSSSFRSGFQSSWIVEPQITYKNVWGKNSVNFLLGWTLQNSDVYQQALLAQGFATDLELENPSAATSVVYNGTSYSSYRYNGGFSQFGYAWDNKYLININGRRDGSSRYGENNRLHNFWSAAAAWVFSNEKFLQENKILSFGKLRFSYGITGNENVGDYQYLTRYTPTQYAYAYDGNGASYTGGGLINPYYKWEETHKWQWGADLGFFKDRILLGINYYYNKSSNQLTNFPLPAFVSGASKGILSNVPAVILNWGWEFNVISQNIESKKFTWKTTFNISAPRNKLSRYPDFELSPYAGPNSPYLLGQSLFTVRLYEYAGINSTTGLFQFKDSEGKLTSNPDFLKDRYVLINTSPLLTGGMTNSFTYKTFSLDVLLQFAQKKGRNFTAGSNPGQFNYGLGYGNQPVTVLEEDNHQLYSTNYANPDLSAAYNALGNSTFGFGRADYIRVKNISLSWALPETWMSKIKFRHSSIQINAQNLFTLTNFKGSDPENPGMLFSFQMPPQRVITIGINAGF